MGQEMLVNNIDTARPVGAVAAFSGQKKAFDRSRDAGRLPPRPIVCQFDAIARQIRLCNARAEYLAQKSVQNELFAILSDTVLEHGIKVISLDVFDTFLLRNNKPEAVRYYKLSGRLLNKIRDRRPNTPNVAELSADDLLLARVHGLANTYRRRPAVDDCREGVISEAIDAQLRMLGLDSSFHELFVEEEVAYESENLTVNPFLTMFVDWARSNDCNVILVSDMYLPAHRIGEILATLPEAATVDRIYSSADSVISKRSGKLFGKIADELGLEPGRFLHMGDSWLGDVVRAREAGWNAQYLPVSDRELHERKVQLAEFVALMERRGFEMQSWAKV